MFKSWPILRPWCRISKSQRRWSALSIIIPFIFQLSSVTVQRDMISPTTRAQEVARKSYNSRAKPLSQLIQTGHAISKPPRISEIRPLPYLLICILTKPKCGMLIQFLMGLMHFLGNKGAIIDFYSLCGQCQEIATKKSNLRELSTHFIFNLSLLNHLQQEEAKNLLKICLFNEKTIVYDQLNLNDFRQNLKTIFEKKLNKIDWKVFENSYITKSALSLPYFF